MPDIKYQIRNAFLAGRVEWQKHAMERMLQRGISRHIVREVLVSGEIIENYPDTRPFPGALFFSKVFDEPFHVVAAYDLSSDYCFVITAYRPDSKYFEQDYKTRRKYEK